MSGAAPRAGGIDSLTAGARRRFALEATGRTVHLKLRAVVRGVTSAVRSGNVSAIRAAAHFQQAGTHQHISHLRLWLRGRLVADYGVPFCVPGPTATIRDKHGGALATVQITIQDVIGFIKITHRHHPLDVVVRGGSGIVRASSAAAARARLPDSGTVSIARRRYAVRSFSERAFGGEPIKVWIIGRA
jgi:hypothetical protein